jgi:hypothetical protein
MPIRSAQAPIAHDCADLKAARHGAIAYIPELLESEAMVQGPNLNRHVRITDFAGNMLMVVRFAEALN